MAVIKRPFRWVISFLAGFVALASSFFQQPRPALAQEVQDEMVDHKAVKLLNMKLDFLMNALIKEKRLSDDEISFLGTLGACTNEATGVAAAQGQQACIWSNLERQYQQTCIFIQAQQNNTLNQPQQIQKFIQPFGIEKKTR